MAKIALTNLRHPDYRMSSPDWNKWRLAYNGGRDFVNAYLKQYSKREDTEDFKVRKELTYCPRFAGAAVDDVKNSIYQRMVDITRTDGDPTYENAVKGLEGGVDLDGSTMNYFLGQLILPELLVMAKVGVYIDMPPIEGETLADAYGKKPYLYYYCAEDIASWTGNYQNNRMTYTSLLLRDLEHKEDEQYGLPFSTQTTWRFYKLTPDGVVLQIFDNRGVIIKTYQFPLMKRIPFVLFETNKSLMEDIADYQIALMNLESTDIDYMRRSNFPFYVEQYDQKAESVQNQISPDQKANDPMKRKEVVTGAGSGRRYPLGTEAPSFIHPSSEPLMASMQKEQQLKNDIRKLLNLSLSNLEPKFASAESKGMDDRSLESGLSAIGLILEHGERQIAEIWAEYLKAKYATVTYPRNYSLKSDAERRDEAESLTKLMPAVPSITYQKTVAKLVARTMTSHITTDDEQKKIDKEIEAAGYISSDAEAITKDLTNGLVSTQTASKARGYAEGEVEQAKKDQAERLALIQKAQTPPGKEPDNPGARGIKDKAPVPGNPKPDNTDRGGE